MIPLKPYSFWFSICTFECIKNQNIPFDWGASSPDNECIAFPGKGSDGAAGQANRDER